MSRKVGHVPAPKSGSGSTIVVPDDIKKEIEELFDYLTENPAEEGFIEFETDIKGTDSEKADALKKEMNEWQRYVRIHCAQNGIKFRQLPSKHLAPNQLRFSLSKIEEKTDTAKTDPTK